MPLLILSIIGLTIVFIFFLVIVRTVSSISNHLTKIEYWVNQESEFVKEKEDVRRALEVDTDGEKTASQPGATEFSLADVPLTAGKKPTQEKPSKK
jgi:Na+-transporting methylmalonyl-CoA/oxaloacetate decarboxylase gamma subunit